MTEKMMMTEVQALELAVKMFKCHEYGANEDFMTEIEGVPCVEKLEHMIEVRSRKRERKSNDSKKLANIALGEEFAKKWTGGEFKASDVAETLNLRTKTGNLNVSKANAICKACGWIEVPTTEKVKVYKL